MRVGQRPKFSVIKLILFDFEDTLAKTSTDYESVRNKVRDFFVSQGLKENLVFKPILSDIKRACQILGSEGLETRAIDIIAQSELDSSLGVTEISGARQTVNFFREKGLKIGVLSRTSLKAIEFCLKELNFPEFDMVLGRESVKNNKPDPEGINMALQKFDVSASEALVVGDHVYDIMAAKRAGAHSIGVLGGISNRESLINEGALSVLNSIKELPSFYEKELIDNNSHTGL